MVADSGRNCVTLSWPKPVHAGDAPVLAYRVEAWRLGCEGGARWTEVRQATKITGGARTELEPRQPAAGCPGNTHTNPPPPVKKKEKHLLKSSRPRWPPREVSISQDS